MGSNPGYLLKSFLIYKKCQQSSGHAVSQFLQFLIINQGWEQGQESHYIQPSNLSSAFSNIFLKNPYNLYSLGLFDTMT